MDHPDDPRQRWRRPTSSPDLPAVIVGILTVAAAGCAGAAGSPPEPAPSDLESTAIWTYEADGEIGFQALTAFGTLLISTPERTVALDPETGDPVWTSTEVRHCRPGFRRKGLLGREATGETECRFRDVDNLEIVFDAGMPILIGHRESHVAVFDVETGTLRWNTEIQGPDLGEGDLLLRETAGDVLVWGRPEDDGTPIAYLNLLTGEAFWTSVVPFHEEFGRPWFADDEVIIVWGDQDGDTGTRMVALDRESGALVWDIRLPFEEDFDRYWASGPRMLLSGKNTSGDKTFVALNVAKGTIEYESESLGRLIDSDEVFNVSLYWYLALEPDDESTTLGALGDSLDIFLIGIPDADIVAIDPTAGQLRWRAEPSGDISDWGYADGTLYVSNEGRLSAYDAFSGRAWQVETDVHGDVTITDHGLLVGCDASRCEDAVQLYDAASGRPVWSSDVDLGDEAAALLDRDTLYILTDPGLIAVDLEDGERTELASFEFQGDDHPTALVPLDDGGLLTYSAQNVLAMDRDGTIRYHEYYEPPGLSTASKLLRVAGAVAATALSYGHASMQANRMAQQFGRGIGFYSVYYPNLVERYTASEVEEERIYIYTEDADTSGREGLSLVRFDPFEGEEDGRAWLGESNPEFILDHLAGVVYLKQGSRTIVAHEFR